MKSFKFSIVYLLLAALLVIQTSHAQKKTHDKNLPNFVQVNANLYRGGQPTEAGIKELAKLGVKTIIDLRGADEHAKNEALWARRAGMNFINKPLNNWARPKNTKIEEIEKLINAPENQPVFVHCQRGADRTGTVIAVYRITHDGWDAERANREARERGFGWWQFWMKDFISDYDRDLKK
ncbi:MAG TPA: tyrosine-protein phosphatase [Pyrinomonadaceae bacterium]